MASGYEKSPDYGGPEPSWREAAGIVAAIVGILAAIAGLVVGLRLLLLHYGLAGG